ncbi:MAG: FecR domain-containing protein [Pseudomonadota bacterium]
MTGDAKNKADRIDDAARDWFLRLNEPGVSSSDRRAFDAWRRADPAHAAAYAEVEATMRDLSASLSPRRRRRRGPVATALAAACLAVFFAPEVLLRIQADHRTATGKPEEIELPDGGIAHLNTASALAIRYTTDRRIVELLRGEAVFEVVSDPSNPFSVVAMGAEAVATGTVYSLRLDDRITVTVLEGAVEVSSGDRMKEITAGQALRFSSDQPPGDQLTASDTALAWRDGFIDLNDMRLDAAVTEIDRYLPGRTLIYGEAAASRVGGQIALDDLETGLEAIALTVGAEITWITPYLRIMR